jgi:hypothetical protein
MALSTAGRTPHFEIAHDQTLPAQSGRDPARKLLETCEDDLELMSFWFRGVELPWSPIDLQIAGSAPEATVRPPVVIVPGPGASSTRVRYLFVTAVSKLFMRAQDRGWLGADGTGPGEALSRFLGAQALAARGLGVPDLDLQPANAWMDGPRTDYVNHPAGDEAAIGCGVLFLSYLQIERKFTVPQIVAAAAPDLGGAYRNLTGDAADPFPKFKELLDGRYPGTMTIDGTHPDNPWPIGHLLKDIEGLAPPMPVMGWGRGGVAP